MHVARTERSSLAALPLAAVVALAAFPACVHKVDDGADEDKGALLLMSGDVGGQLIADVDGWARTAPVAVTGDVSRIGVRFDASGPVAVEGRVSFDGAKAFSRWRPLTVTFTEEIANNAFVDIDDLVASAGRPATHVQLRFLSPVESALSFVALDAFQHVKNVESASSTAQQGLAADGIAIPRDQWGARSVSCNTPQTPRQITIHHTESPNGDTMSMPARLRQLQSYAIDVRGFCDIGFHFLVGQDGQVYEGREEDHVGAHASGANQDNVGIAFVGTYSSSAPSSAMMAAAARIMGSLSSTYGIALSSSTVKGHRDINGTDCPGDALYAQIGSLISAALNSTPSNNGNNNGGNGNNPPPPSSGVYAGLTQGTATIPHQGVHNGTLQSSFGLSSEPYGTVVTAVNGQQFVQGKVSWFGGPDDTGVTSTETGSVGGNRLRSLNTPTNASAATIASRPQDFYYLAMRWDYAPGHTFWKNARILVVNPDNGVAVVLRPEDWGPNPSTHRILDISPQAMKDLGTDTDHELLVAFAAPDAPLGVVSPSALNPPPPSSPPSSGTPPSGSPPSSPPSSGTPPSSSSTPPSGSGQRIIPAGASWQWQLTGAIDTSVNASVYDIDLFDAPTATIANLKSMGRTVICYFSAGTYEPWRADASQFPSSAIGTSLGGDFANESWLDTRDATVRNIMKSRLDFAAQKGCNGVEPDNVDGYTNSPGFPLTASTQLDFNRFIASEAHNRGLSVGLKNDVDQLSDLVDDFDWALNEQCYDYQECGGYSSTFIAEGKAVLNAEYDASDQLSAICAVTQPLGLSTILKDTNLDAARVACP